MIIESIRKEGGDNMSSSGVRNIYMGSLSRSGSNNDVKIDDILGG